jgi:hypothetical protein
MLGDITDQVKGLLDPILSLVKSVSHSTKWPKLVKNHRYATLPSYSSTRWYSLFRLIRNAVHLKGELTQFIRDQNAGREGKDIVQPSFACWDAASHLLPVLETFKMAIELIESDEFGTLGHVYEAFGMIQEAIGRQFLRVCPKDVDLKACDLPENLPHCVRLDDYLDALRQGWNKAYTRRWIGMSDKTRNHMLMATMLNPSSSIENLKEQDLMSGRFLLKAAYDEIRDQDEDDESHSDSMEETPIDSQAVSRNVYLGMKTSDNELARFLNLTREPFADAEQWWFANKDVYPILFRLAQKWLHVPATSASSERQFSKAKRLKPKKRWSIKPLKLGSMVVVAENSSLVDRAIARRRGRNGDENG